MTNEETNVIQMPYIQNISRQDCALGFHADPLNNTILIQISECDFVTPKYKDSFSAIFQFWFDDVEDENDERAITQEQAEKIAALLQTALLSGKNVIVHCQAGICRSGAVAEVGVMIGFTDGERFRKPNNLVKQRLMKALNIKIDTSTSMFNNTDI